MVLEVESYYRTAGPSVIDVVNIDDGFIYPFDVSDTDNLTVRYAF